jgi:hypothetical protein
MAVKFTKPEINVREKLAELDKPSGIAGEAMLRAETPQEQFNLIGAGRRNIIINGDMRVAQRGTTGTLNNGGGGFHSADRFLSQEEGAFTGAFTISNDSDSPKGFSNSTKWDCTTADTSLAAADSIFVDYKPEAQDLQHLNYGTPDALQMTASFWIKSNKTGTYVLWLYQYDDGRQVSAPYTINSADTWEYKTLLIPADPTGVIDNNNGAGLVLRFVMGSGSNQSSGTTPSAWESLVEANRYAGQTVNLADSTSNYMNITGIQLEIGEVATPFEHRSYGEELALCQRYYYKINSAENNANYQRFAMVNIETSTEAEALFIHPVTMRAIPTLETTAVSGFHIFSANAVSVVSGMAIDQASPHSVGVALTASGGGLTGGYVGLLDANNNKTAQLAFNAEL